MEPLSTESGRRREPPYGWAIVLLAAVAMAATLPGRTHGLGMITKQLLADFSMLSQQDFGRINLWATLLGALFCLPCGWLLDRFGIRMSLTVVLGSLAAVALWMSAIRDVPSLVVAITLSRGLGQSMLSVISITMVGKWFGRNVPVAMGVYSVAMSVLMAASAYFIPARIEAAGWRAGWSELGWALAAVTPVCALLACDPRRRPAAAVADQPTASAEPSATLAEALRTPAFWVFALSISFFGLVSSGISLWQRLILDERGLPAHVFASVLAIGFLTGMVTNLVTGGLARFVNPARLLAAAMLLLGVAYVLLPLAKTPAHAYGFAVIQGIAGGMLTVLFFAVWRPAFGARNLGRIQGAAQMLTVLASAVGPLIVAESNSAAGTYSKILFAFAAVSASFAFVAVLTPVPVAAAGCWNKVADKKYLPAAQESLA